MLMCRINPAKLTFTTGYAQTTGYPIAITPGHVSGASWAIPRPSDFDFDSVIRPYGLLAKFERSVFSPGNNPAGDPYSDGAFVDFHILIVCLYMGAYEQNAGLMSESNFKKQCGQKLLDKGFQYDFVYSYGDAIQELTQQVNGRCRYAELWLFSSPGYGFLPDDAKDKDPNKIAPFLEAVRDFWLHGGGLLLFCDNDPYTFEVNYLFEHYLDFACPDGTKAKTQLRLGGLECSLGTSKSPFKGWLGKEMIHVVGPNDAWPAVGTFSREVELRPAKQKGQIPRLTLRPGLVEFFEGNTISYAVDSQGTPISNPDDLWPFTSFACASGPDQDPHPFILFHDPEITSPVLDCPGPIVVHGGFTAPFECDSDTTGGVGRLMVSIACWLTHIEERLPLEFQASANGVSPIPRNVPALVGAYSPKATFT
jgi:hypothetical protein